VASGLLARVVRVEAQVEGHSENMNGIRETLSTMDARIDRRFEAVDRRFEAIAGRLDRQFLWMVGLQVTTLVTVIGAIVTAVLTR